MQAAIHNEAEPRARPLRRSDLVWFGEFFHGLSAPLADINPLVTLAWRESARLDYVVERGVLYLFGDTDFGRVLWIPPLSASPLSKGHILRGLNLLRANQRHPDGRMILNLSEDYPLWTQVCNDPAFVIERSSTEYQYETSAIASLAGHGLRTKRADARFFLNANKPRVARFEPRFAPECLGLLEKWLAQKKASSTLMALPKAKREYQVCKNALAEQLPLDGIVCIVGSRLVGFSLGTFHGAGTFNCVFEKTDLELRGSGAFVFSSLAAYLLGRYAIINAGEDWGLPELALAKRLWRPIIERPIYRLIER
jgi:hypothetical protein